MPDAARGPMHRFAGKVVVVTGASSGIGRATARAFAREGGRLALIARGREGLDRAAEEAQREGAEALVLQVDVSDHDAVERAASEVEDRLGPIDVWVNNAMVTVFSPVMRMDDAEYRRVTDVTYLGSVWGSRAALRRMLPRDRGTIVQIGSALGMRSIPLQSAYCASKAALRGFTDSLRSELIHDGSRVRLTMVHLPAVNTPQFVVQRNKLDRRAQPVPPIYHPELAASAILWAAEHAPRQMVVGGSALAAIYGQIFTPDVADRYLAAQGYDAQQTDEPNDPERPGNLFDPVPGDPGARGPFSDRASGRSAQLWLRMRSPSPAIIASILVSAVTAVVLARVARS